MKDGSTNHAGVAAAIVMLAASLSLSPNPALASPGSPNAGPQSAVYSVASIDVLPQMRSRGAAIIAGYVARVRSDRRVKRVWYLQEATTPNHFQLIEELPSRAAYRDHLAQRYVLEFRDRLHPVLGSPYDERVFADAGR